MASPPEDAFVYEDRAQLPAILPIFPLPNVVFIPNTTLPLFIFEERYKRMVQDCLAGDRYLAVALLQKGWEHQPGPPRPYPIAGFGRIVRATRLPNDCMDIVVQGLGRIEMTALYDDRAYLRAAVTLVRPTYPADQSLTALAEAMRSLFLQFLDLKGLAAPELRRSLKLLASPIDLVFFITAHLPLDVYVKQEILQTTAVDAQIAQLTRLLKAAIGSHLN